MPTTDRQMNYFIFARRTQEDEFALHLRKSVDPHLVVYCAIVTAEKRSLSVAIEYLGMDFSSDGNSSEPQNTYSRIGNN